MYKRKTEDEWRIMGFYPDGWEELTTETTWKEAKANVKAYRENEPGTRFKVVKKRVKIAPPVLYLNGETAKEWADNMFRYEYCQECGKDQEDHDIIPFMGNWFARCKSGGEEHAGVQN